MKPKTKSRKKKRFEWQEKEMTIVFYQGDMNEIWPYDKGCIIVHCLKVFGYHTMIKDRFTIIHTLSGYPIASCNTKKEARTLVKMLEMTIIKSKADPNPYIGPYNPDEDIPF